MPTDLEQRRLAIVEALRAIMAEPLPTRQQADEESSPADDWDEWDEEDFQPLEDSFVPPMESAGTMSRMASLALFGHA
jgi:hypothetical protein